MTFLPPPRAPRFRFTLTLLILLLLGGALSGCDRPPSNAPRDATSIQQTAFRVRANAQSQLNADAGWAAAVNKNATLAVEQPFRLRFEVEHPTADSTRYRLQYQRNDEPWTTVPAADFPYPAETTPRVSIVSTDGYADGTATADLLDGSDAPFRPGVGVRLADTASASTDTAAPTDTAVSTGTAVSADRVQSEWEWPVVIRRFADGAVTNENGDAFSFRMVDATGRVVLSDAYPTLTATIPPRLVGGTFVETPGRIGPWEAANGDLYFLMEPAETFNVLMVVTSIDGGRTWREVDGANRPETGDLEGFASDLHDATIHMLHQTDEAVLYHAFHTSDHPTTPNTWAVRDDTVATPGEPPVQVASLTARSDGSLVAVFGAPKTIHTAVRSADGMWGKESIIEPSAAALQSGPQTVLGADDGVHLAYTARDGTAWYRRIQPDDTLTPRVQIAAGLGTEESDVGAIAPLVYLSKTNTVVILYRRADGTLWARRVMGSGMLTEPVRVTTRRVAQNAVDSDQVGADAIGVEGAVHVLFIEDGTGHIFYTRSDSVGTWRPAAPQVKDINAQWVRGQPLEHGDGRRVYGFVYDAGSNGGSGLNRYAEVALP